MKFIHTADWHIGKTVNEFSMLEDQKYILEKFIDYIKKEKPEALVIAGDLYDRSVPPANAVAFLNEFFSRVIIDLKTPIIAISGNHDSGERLSFASQILEKQGLYIVGELKKEIKPVTIKDTDFYLIPYCDPAVVRAIYGDDTLRTHEEAMQKIIDGINNSRDKSRKAVIVAHGYITNISFDKEMKREDILKEIDLEISESERPLSMGGTDIISGKIFDGFDYVALGHLHGQQNVGSERIRYSGSPLKYSLSEENHNKSFTVVELLDEDINIEKIPLTPWRDMRNIKGELKTLISKEYYSLKNTDDYVYALLEDEGELHDPIATLRAIYPNIMGLKRENKKSLEYQVMELNKAQREKSKLELFSDFYENVTQMVLTDARKKIVSDIIESVEGDL